MVRLLTDEHRTIVVVDVAAFANPARTLLHQVDVHDGLYRILKQAFDQSGIPLKHCHLEDRGDGVMILIPPEFPKSRLADKWPNRLLAGLREYNAARSPESGVRLRVALHAGEVHMDEYGVASASVVHAFRVLDAKAAKTALAMSGGTLALIASDWFFHNVIRHQPDASLDLYQQITVSVKETEMTAWLRLPEAHDAAAPPSAAGPASVVELVGPASVVDLVDAALAVPILSDGDGRTLIFDQLRPELANAVPYFTQPRYHLLALIQTCMQYPGALADLVEVVRQLEGDTQQVRRFAAVAGVVLAPADDTT